MVHISQHAGTDGATLLTVAGEIDMATADELAAGLKKAMTSRPTTKVIVDFDQVTFCDSSGIRVLDEAYADAQAHGARLRLINVRRPVRLVLEIAGVFDALTQP